MLRRLRGTTVDGKESDGGHSVAISGTVHDIGGADMGSSQGCI